MKPFNRALTHTHTYTHTHTHTHATFVAFLESGNKNEDLKFYISYEKEDVNRHYNPLANTIIQFWVFF